MSTRSLLPMHQHQRNSSGIIILAPSSRGILRSGEKRLLLGVIATFMFFCCLGMVYLPDMKTSQLYSKYLVAQADSLGPNLLGLPVPPLESVHQQHDHNNENQESEDQAVLPRPRGRFEDEIRLKAKIQEHFNLSQEAVIPKPNYILPGAWHDPSVASVRISPPMNVSALLDGGDTDPEVRKKRDFVKNMMIISWDNYKKYAWGDNELKPISKRGHSAGIFGTSKLGMCDRPLY